MSRGHRFTVGIGQFYVWYERQRRVGALLDAAHREHKKWANDPEYQARLWKLIEKLSKVEMSIERKGKLEERRSQYAGRNSFNDPACPYMVVHSHLKGGRFVSRRIELHLRNSPWLTDLLSNDDLPF